MYVPNVAIFTHDMRHTRFRMLTVVNGTPGNEASQVLYFFSFETILTSY